MPDIRSRVSMSKRSILAGFRRSVTKNPETSELSTTHGRGSLTPFATWQARVLGPPLEGGVVWTQK